MCMHGVCQSTAEMFQATLCHIVRTVMDPWRGTPEAADTFQWSWGRFEARESTDMMFVGRSPCL